jgi:predicted MFS family arabinose efflux permease
MFDPDTGWRVAFWVGLLPALLIFFVRKGQDDSDIYKAAKARQDAGHRHAGLAAIFSSRVLGITLLTALLSFGVQGAAYSVANFLTQFMTAERGLTQSVASFCVLANSFGGLIGCLTNAYLSDKLGRRAVFRLFGIGFVIMAAVYLYGPWGGDLMFLIPVGLVYGGFQFGLYASFGPYFTELFPTELRGSGQAFAYNSGRAAAALYILGVPMLAGSISLSAAMAVFAIAAILIAIVTTFLLPETAGRQLQSLSDLGQPGPAAGKGDSVAPAPEAAR